MAKTKPKKKKAADLVAEVVAEVEVEADVEAEEPPKIVLKDRHALRDPKAKKMVHCKVTLNLPSAGGVMMQLRKGAKVPVPAEAVEDLRRTGCIH